MLCDPSYTHRASTPSNSLVLDSSFLRACLVYRWRRYVVDRSQDLAQSAIESPIASMDLSQQQQRTNVASALDETTTAGASASVMVRGVAAVAWLLMCDDAANERASE